MSLLQGTESGQIDVAFVQLIAEKRDDLGYITYVFKCLEDEMIKRTPYIMCVRYPNWSHRKISLGERGFLKFQTVEAGVDSWYNGKKRIPYKYTAIQFLKFIEETPNKDHKYVM